MSIFEVVSIAHSSFWCKPEMKGHNRNGIDESGRLNTFDEKRNFLHKQAVTRASLVLLMAWRIRTQETRLVRLLSVINQKELIERCLSIIH